MNTYTTIRFWFLIGNITWFAEQLQTKFKVIRIFFLSKIPWKGFLTFHLNRFVSIMTWRLQSIVFFKIAIGKFSPWCFIASFTTNFMPLLANDPVRNFEVRPCLLPFNCVLESISILQNRKYEKRVYQQIRAFFVLLCEDSQFPIGRLVQNLQVLHCCQYCLYHCNNLWPLFCSRMEKSSEPCQ